MKKKEYTRFVVYLDEGDKPLLEALRKDAKKYRVSVSAMASYSMQAGLAFVENHFEKLSSKKKEEIKSK
jgi:hypothetical protein